tara:strand:- start:12455 stop:13225 length:771 start_codon:yes stop_codon:yes gene_type:complete
MTKISGIQKIKNFNKNGYTIIKVFERNDIKDLISIIKKRFSFLSNNQVRIKFLSKLHKEKMSQNAYEKIIKSSTRYIDIGGKKLKKVYFNNDLRSCIKSLWDHSNMKIVWVGDPKKLELKNNRVGFRIARPSNKLDVAKEHIDMYNKDLKSFVSLWVPLIGFDPKYTLQIYPKSHKFSHKKNIFAKKNKISRTLKKNYFNKLKKERPKLKIGEGILFHPNSIHGGSYNTGKITRASIEFRIFNKHKFDKTKTFNLT